MSSQIVSRNRGTVKTYLKILSSFMHGYIRLLEAQTCILKLSGALLNFRQKPRGPFEGNEYEDVLSTFRSISRSSYVAVEYVTAVSYLVYATSLFDTFLTDTVTFLFLLVPEAMGKDLQIPLKTVLSAESRSSALEQVAASKARELSFRTFADRLQFLRDRFGMPVTVTTSDMERLIRFTNTRNSAVHDQGILELKLSRTGTIASGLKGCPDHPTRLANREADEAGKLYYEMSKRIGCDVLTHVLKVKKSGLPPDLKPYCEESPTRASKAKAAE